MVVPPAEVENGHTDKLSVGVSIAEGPSPSPPAVTDSETQTDATSSQTALDDVPRSETLQSHAHSTFDGKDEGAVSADVRSPQDGAIRARDVFVETPVAITVKADEVAQGDRNDEDNDADDDENDENDEDDDYGARGRTNYPVSSGRKSKGGCIIC